MQPLLVSHYTAHYLNRLIADAMVHPQLQQQLINHDHQLIHDYELPEEVWQIITSIQCISLEDFCAQLTVLDTYG